jgi:hypothetical protein
MDLKEIKSQCRTFQFGEDPELIHVIKTGFKNRYMVVHEDAYEFLLGKVEFRTREEIKKVYGIDV